MEQVRADKHTISDLRQMQSLPLEQKIIMTKQRIKVWYESWHKFKIYNEKTKKHKYVTIDARDRKEPRLYKNQYIEEEYDGQIFVSFSGGKDSTVLLHIARQMYPDIEAVFSDTGLEYPEIKSFVKTFDNVTIIRPEMVFDEVVRKYGYPIISKEVCTKINEIKKGSPRKDIYLGKNNRYNIAKYEPLASPDVDFNVSSYCCQIMKKLPIGKYRTKSKKVSMTATLADESRLRTQAWLKNGCNAFDNQHPISTPMAFWTEQDVLEYIYKYKIPIASVYGEVELKNGKYRLTGVDRTGCVFCGFGLHMEKGITRFERLQQSHPKLYNYCLNGGHKVDGVWQPDKTGLGMKYVFDKLNEIYGEGFVIY